MSYKTYRLFRSSLLLFLVSLTLSLTIARTEEHSDKLSCATQVQDIPIDHAKANAGFMANLSSKPGSVSFESEAIFRRAKDQLQNLEKPAPFCKSGCTLRDLPFVYFKSEPRKFLSEYKDKDYCLQQKSQTTQTPLKYLNDKLSTVEELVAWIGEMAQGKGTEGKDLYQRCDRSCSPRYEYRITKKARDDPYFFAIADVICGEARDKADNLYDLEAFFRWQCVSSK